MTDEPGKDGLSPLAQQMRAAAPYLSAVWKLTGGTAVGVLGGYWLDQWLGTSPWVLVGLAAVGTSVGFYGFIRDMLRLGAKK